MVTYFIGAVLPHYKFTSWVGEGARESSHDACVCCARYTTYVLSPVSRTVTLLVSLSFCWSHQKGREVEEREGNLLQRKPLESKQKQHFTNVSSLVEKKYVL